MATNQRASITMSEAEIAVFIEQQRTATIATVGPSGFPHLVAMWYAVFDDHMWIETKAKSQKVANLRRNDQVTILLEDGQTYDTLRGVSFEGRGVVIDDPDTLWRIGVSVFERHMGPYTEEMRPLVAAMIHNRIVVRIDVERVRSWDHRKLGMPSMEVGGSTAKYLNGGEPNL